MSTASPAQLFGALIPPPLLMAARAPLLPTKPLLGPGRLGRHLIAQRGSTVDFFEHQRYEPGHDLRRIDWRASARRDHPLVRHGHYERARPLYVLLDSHAGMDYGTGSSSRWQMAKGIGATLVYQALKHADPVALLQTKGGPSRASGHPQALGRMAKTLGEHTCQGPSQMLDMVQMLLARKVAPGPLVCIGDWLDLQSPSNTHDQALAKLESALALLSARGFLLWGLELLHPHEIELEFEGKASDPRNFVDPRGQHPPCVASPQTLRNQYKKALATHRSSLGRMAKRARMHWSSLRCDQPWGSSLLRAAAALEAR